MTFFKLKSISRILIFLYPLSFIFFGPFAVWVCVHVYCSCVWLAYMRVSMFLFFVFLTQEYRLIFLSSLFFFFSPFTINGWSHFTTRFSLSCRRLFSDSLSKTYPRSCAWSILKHVWRGKFSIICSKTPLKRGTALLCLSHEKVSAPFLPSVQTQFFWHSFSSRSACARGASVQLVYHWLLGRQCVLDRLRFFLYINANKRNSCTAPYAPHIHF